jgi:hypothetical protein
MCVFVHVEMVGVGGWVVMVVVVVVGRVGGS